eukprot:jgi/Bigna1/85811/estExt_fgenesh1_pg.C_60180
MEPATATELIFREKVLSWKQEQDDWLAKKLASKKRKQRKRDANIVERVDRSRQQKSSVKVGATANVHAFGNSIAVWESDDVAGYGGTLWAQACGLTQFIFDPSNHFKGMKIIELGAGLGLVAIAAAQQGADVTCTDRQLEALELAQLNAERNRVAIACRPIDWANANHREYLRSEHWDVVLGAAVIYHIDMISPLLQTIKASLLPPREHEDDVKRRKYADDGHSSSCRKESGYENWSQCLPVALITCGNEMTREVMFCEEAKKQGLAVRIITYSSLDSEFGLRTASPDGKSYTGEDNKRKDGDSRELRVFIITLHEMQASNSSKLRVNGSRKDCCTLC